MSLQVTTNAICDNCDFDVAQGDSIFCLECWNAQVDEPDTDQEKFLNAVRYDLLDAMNVGDPVEKHRALRNLNDKLLDKIDKLAGK